MEAYITQKPSSKLAAGAIFAIRCASCNKSVVIETIGNKILDLCNENVTFVS